MEDNQESKEKPEDPKDDEENIVESIFDRKSDRKRQSSIIKGQTNVPPDQDASSHLVKSEQISMKDLPKTESKSIEVNKILDKNLPVGIDIGTHSIKIAQVEIVNGKARLAKLLVNDLPLELCVNPLEREKSLKSLLTQIIKENDLGVEVYMSLPTDVIKFKNIYLPQMPEDEFSSAIDWELKQKAGGKYNDFTFDYIVLKKSSEGEEGKQEVLTISAEKQFVISRLKLLESLGLETIAMEPEMLSLVASLIHSQAVKEDEVNLVLDLGGSATTLNIIKNMELHFSRTLHISSHALTVAIKDYCRMSLDDAEKLKKDFHKMGVAQDVKKNSNVKNAVTLLLEKLVTDIEHTFKHYSYQLTKSRVKSYNNIILSGGGANFSMLQPFLAERLHVPVLLHDPLTSMDFQNSQIKGKSHLEEISPRLGVAVGLSLRAIDE